MPSGLQVLDAGGNVIFDTSSIVGRIFGVIEINTTNTSGTVTATITDARFAEGTVFCTLMFRDVSNYTSAWSYSLSGNTITLSRSGVATSAGVHIGTFMYGVISK